MKNLILIFLVIALPPIMPLMGLSYDYYDLGEGIIPYKHSYYFHSLRSGEFLMNGNSQAITCLNSLDEDDERWSSYPLLFDPTFDDGLKRLPLPTNIPSHTTYWKFKGKYILGSFRSELEERADFEDKYGGNGYDPDIHLFLYDIEREEMIILKELAKEQGVEMYGYDDSDEIEDLYMNDSGVLVGTWLSSIGQSVFAYYPDQGLKIIGPDELGMHSINSYPPHLNNQGQFIFYGEEQDDKSIWRYKKYYLYDPHDGVVELTDLTNKIRSLFIDHEIDFYSDQYCGIRHFNDRGDLLIELEVDYFDEDGFTDYSKINLYHYNLQTKELVLIDENGPYEDYFINNQGNVLLLKLDSPNEYEFESAKLKLYRYDLQTKELTFNLESNFNYILDSRGDIVVFFVQEDDDYANYVWHNDSNHLIRSPVSNIYGLDDHERIIGTDEHGQLVIWNKESGIHFLSDLVKSPEDIGEIFVEDISVDKSGEILLEYTKDGDTRHLMMLTPKE